MSIFRERARRYHDAIHAILLHEWDPIGVGDSPEAHDEYDSYIPTVYSILIHHLDRGQLFDYLWQVETQHMGLRGSRQRTNSIVDRLLQMRDELESST
jgi:hypothetical protein